MTFEQRAYEYEFQLNDTDDDVISYIRENRENIKNISIQKIASELYVAPNTIMRLAKKLGYSGFSELKFSIQRENQPLADEGKTIGSELLGSLPENIARTIDVIDEKELKRAIQAMHDAHCCIFAGVGDSSYFCEILGKNLRCLDVYVQYYTHIHDMIYAISHGNREDALIVISARGTNKRLLKLAEDAHNKGMKVISVTHFNENPLVELADIALYFWGENQVVQGYNVTDRSGLMVLVRLLSEEYWRHYTDRLK